MHGDIIKKFIFKIETEIGRSVYTAEGKSTVINSENKLKKEGVVGNLSCTYAELALEWDELNERPLQLCKIGERERGT